MYSARLVDRLGNRMRNSRTQVYFLAYCLALLISYGFISLKAGYPGFPLGGPGDFTNYYTAGIILTQSDPAGLYDLDLQRHIQQELLEPYGYEFAGGVLPYMNPPFLALPFAVLSLLPFGQAFLVWYLLHLMIIASSIALLVRECGLPSTRTPLLALLIVLAFFPTFRGLINGQSSFLVLLAVVLSYMAFRRGRDFLGGMALAIGLAKPHLILVLLLMLAFKRRWHAIMGFGLIALLLLIISWFVVGIDGLTAYVKLTASAGTSTVVPGFYPELMPNLRGSISRLAAMLAPEQTSPATTATSFALIAAVAAILVGLTLVTWRGRWAPGASSFDLLFALALTCSLIVSPHLYAHDLILLVPVGLLLVAYYSSHQRSWVAQTHIGIGHVLPFAAFVLLGDSSAAQLSALFMAVLVIVLFFEYQRSHGRTRPGDCDKT